MPSISSKAVIGNAISRFGITNTNFTSNAIDAIGRVIGLIGYHTGFESHVVELNVCNNISSLPCGFVTHRGFLYKGKGLDRRQDSPAYYNPQQYVGRRDEGNSVLDPYLLELQKTLAIRDKVYELPKGEDRDIAIQRTEHTIKQNTEFLLKASEHNRSECEWYYMEDVSDYVQYSFTEGNVHLIYERFKLDINGYPLVVDQPKYNECLEWYLLTRAMEGGFRHPVFSYGDAFAQYEKYLAQARNEPLVNDMMDDKMEAFTELWTGDRFNVGVYANYETNYNSVRESRR